MNQRLFAWPMGHIILTIAAVFNWPAFAQDQWIIKVRANAIPRSNAGYQTSSRALLRHATLNTAREMQALSAEARVRALPTTGYVIFQGNKEDLESFARNNPNVEYAEKNILYRPAYDIDQSNNPAGNTRSPWMDDVLELGVDSNPRIDLGTAGGDPVVPVAIIDTGMNYQHPYFATPDPANGNAPTNAALHINAAETPNDGIDNDGNGYIDDVYGANVFYRSGDVRDNGTDHGSHVAGLVGNIRAQSIPYDSRAARVKLLPIRFINETGVGSTSGAIMALEYAASRGAKVVNASWGARGTEAFSQAMYDAFVEAYWVHDMVIAVAAGNAEVSGPNNNDVIPYFPASFDIPGQITVASVSPTYNGSSVFTGVGLSRFSNYGRKAVHITAPGGYGDTSDPDGGVWSVNAHPFSVANHYTRKKGTSMAAPVLAGVAAVVRAINPSLTAYETIQLLMNTATVKSSLASAVSSSGIVNARLAYLAAPGAVSQGLKPVVPPLAYRTTSSDEPTQPTKKKGGGCGAISAAESGTDGPWGGNGLILFSLVYWLATWLRQVYRRKFNTHRV